MTFADPSPEQVALLAGLVPNLRHLTILHTITAAVVLTLMGLKGSQLPSPPFPSLECLKFIGDAVLEAADLEALIRSRCLFRGHPESTMDDGIQQALVLLEMNLGCWGLEWIHTPFLERYLVTGDSNAVLYRVVGQT